MITMLWYSYYGIAWYGTLMVTMIWSSVMWYGMITMVWHGIVWYDNWYDNWYGIVSHGVMLCNVVWYGIVWYCIACSNRWSTLSILSLHSRAH